MIMSASTPSTVPEIDVAAGVLTDQHDRVLVAQHVQPDAYQGQWEFPGGKLEPGEDAETALRRELAEELGIKVEATEALIHVRYEYPDRHVRLHVFRVIAYRGDPSGLEGQPLKWLLPGELDDCPLLAANRPIVRALQLPRRYVITDIARFGLDQTCDRLVELLRAQPAMIQIREKNIPDEALRVLVNRIHSLCEPFRAKVLLNAAPEVARSLPVQGVHLTARRLWELRARPLPRPQWVGASCHNARDLSQAARIDADFAVLGPVNATDTHPGAVTLGWARFKSLCHGANLPVYALGGMHWDDTARAIEAGAQGIAVIRAAWR